MQLSPLDKPKDTFIRYAQEGNIVAMKQHIVAEKQDVSINRKDVDERTALHWASANGHVEGVAFLLEKFGPNGLMNLDHQDDSGWTALMSATSSGHDAIVEMLLKAGANANLSNTSGQLPLHYHKSTY